MREHGVPAAPLTRPIEGGARIAQYMVAIADKAPGLELLERSVNGVPGLVAQRAGAVMTVAAFGVPTAASGTRCLLEVGAPAGSAGGRFGHGAGPHACSVVAGACSRLVWLAMLAGAPTYVHDGHFCHTPSVTARALTEWPGPYPCACSNWATDEPYSAASSAASATLSWPGAKKDPAPTFLAQPHQQVPVGVR